MAVLRFEIAYEGAHFHGWQRQPQVATVQGEIEQAIATLFGQPLRVFGASRTDAGVHAAGQVVSLPLPEHASGKVLTPYRIVRALNALTHESVSVMRAEIVEALDHQGLPFHARHCARGKIYRYHLWLSNIPHPMLRHTCWGLRRSPDAEGWARVRAAAARLIGEHDFAGFRSSSCDAPTTSRHIQRIELSLPQPGQWPRAEILVQGNAFLKNMVRILVGTLIDVGLGALPLERIDEILATGDRRLGGQTAPAQGLSLEEVFYPDFPWAWARWETPPKPPPGV